MLFVSLGIAKTHNVCQVGRSESKYSPRYTKTAKHTCTDADFKTKSKMSVCNFALAAFVSESESISQRFSSRKGLRSRPRQLTEILIFLDVDVDGDGNDDDDIT